MNQGSTHNICVEEIPLQLASEATANLANSGLSDGDVVNGSNGPVADHLTPIGREPPFVLTGRDLVAGMNLGDTHGEMPAAGVDLASVDAGLLAALVEAFGCFVGRRHQQTLVAGPSAFPPGSDAGSFHLIQGARVEPAVLLVDLGDGDVTTP